MIYDCGFVGLAIKEKMVSGIKIIFITCIMYNKLS